MIEAPAWAEKALSKPNSFDAAELELLRDFFTEWESFHKITGPGNIRKKREEAATRLVAKAHIIRRIQGNG